MKTKILILSGLLVAAFVTSETTVPAQALTMKECSVKYKAAQAAGTLNGMKWNDFRKAECGATATAAPATTPAPTTTTAAPAPAPAPTTRTATPAPAPAPAPVTTGNAVFPSAVSPKYANDTPGKARMQTCLDQYRLNKANNGNGGLKWIEKGGGYWSECNKHLKGA
jgi:hypothetical protein